MKFHSFILWQFNLIVGGASRHIPHIQTFTSRFGLLPWMSLQSARTKRIFLFLGNSWLMSCTYPFMRHSDLKEPVSKPANLQLPTLKLAPTSATYPHTSEKFADLSPTWAGRPAAKHLMRPQKMLVVPRPLLVYYHAHRSCSYTWHVYTACFPSASPKIPSYNLCSFLYIPHRLSCHPQRNLLH